MAENGNREPNEIRARNVRKRREPPIIDASATEVPVDSVEPVVTADAAPLSAAEPLAQGAEAASREASLARETGEPVLFGTAVRDPVPTSDGSGVPTGTSDAAVGPDLTATDAAPTADEAAAAAPRATFGGGGATSPRSPVFGTAGASVPPGALPPTRSSGGAAPWLLTLSTLALLGALAWVLYTEPQRDGHAEIAELQSKVAALEARPDPSQGQPDVAALDKRLSDAEAARTALATTVTGLTTRLDAVAQAADTAKADADRAASAAGVAQSDADRSPATGAAAVATVGALAALAEKVDGVDRNLTTLSADQARTAKAVTDLPKPVAPDFGPIEARLAGVESQLSGKVSALDAQLTALDGKVNGSDARLNGFDAKVNAVDGKINGFDARMNAGEARVNALEAKANGSAADLGKLQAAVAALPVIDLAPVKADIAALQGQLSATKDGTRATEARAVGSADETRATPIALVGQAVQRAVADGRPYAGDLDTLKALGAEPDAIAKLQPLAASGVPTAAALKARWDAVEGDVLATVKPAQAGSALERLAQGAKALVQVRRVGAVAGDDPGALVSQIDAALDDGDVAGALAAWSKLPQAGQDKSQDWAAAAKTRVEAAQAAQGLVRRAIATLGRTKS